MNEPLTKSFFGVVSGADTFPWWKLAGLSPVSGCIFDSSSTVDATCNACLKAVKTAVKGLTQLVLGFYLEQTISGCGRLERP